MPQFNFYLKLFFIFWSFVGLEAYGTCRLSFVPAAQKRSSIPAGLFPTAAVPKPRSHLRSNPHNRSAKYVVKQRIKNNLRDALLKNDLRKIESLIVSHPFLREKNIRFTEPSILKKIPEHLQALCPLGIGLYHFAVIHRNYELLDMLLYLKVNIRTNKMTGGVSLESNALHLAIRQGFLPGVTRIVNTPHLSNDKKTRGFFIDEKDNEKQTPFSLAVEQAVKSRRYAILELVAKNSPSGEVEVLSRDAKYAPLDGLSIALNTGNPRIIQIAEEYLRFSPYYQTNKRKKARFPKTRTRDLNPVSF